MSTLTDTSFSAPTRFVRTGGRLLSFGVALSKLRAEASSMSPTQLLSAGISIVGGAEALLKRRSHTARQDRLHTMSTPVLALALSVNGLNAVRNGRLAFSGTLPAGRRLTRLSRVDRSAALIGDALCIAEVAITIYERRRRIIAKTTDFVKFARMVWPMELEQRIYDFKKYHHPPTCV